MLKLYFLRLFNYVNAINKFHGRENTLLENEAFWLDVARHVPSFSQSKCIIFELHSYTNIYSWHLLQCESYKHFMLVIYDSRVVVTTKILYNMPQESQITSVRCL